MSAIRSLNRIDAAHTEVIEVVHRLKTVGFIVIKEQSATI